jgi:hypothetical protein
MGHVELIECDNCSFSVETVNGLNMITCYENLDYFDKLYCNDCKKVVEVWRRKNGKDIEIIKCPTCNSTELFGGIPEDVIILCPKCEKGKLRSEIIIFTD